MKIIKHPAPIRPIVVISAVILVFFGVNTAFASPAAPDPVVLTQPDGTTFVATQFGDEWYSGHEHNGFTILENKIDGYWVYALPNDMGTLDASSLRVGIDAPLRPMQQHLRDTDSTDAAPYFTRPSNAPDATTVWPGASGSQLVLLLLVDFTPTTSLGTSAAQWNARLFDNTNGVKSVKNFYEEASYNQFTIDPAAETQGTANDGVIEVTLGYAHPNTGSSTGPANRLITRDALIAADPFIDFSALDSDASGSLDVTEVHIIVVPRGYETAYGGSGACSPSVWGHRWALDYSETPTLDGIQVGGSGGGYMQVGEWHDTTGGTGCPGNTEGNMASIGIIAHELGHDIDWPDLYDTDQSSQGIGAWGLMSSGNWGKATGDPSSGTTPILPTGWSKWYQNWLTPIEVTNDMTGVNIPVSSQNDTIYQLGDNPNGVDWDFGDSIGTGEYFLIENRQHVGFDAGLQRYGSTVKGCIIMHIDETRTASNSNNNEESRKMVDVEEASAIQQLDGGESSNRGDSNDPWPGSNNMTVFDTASNPNSNLYSGAVIDISVFDISTAGEGCMVSFDVDSAPEAIAPELNISLQDGEPLLLWEHLSVNTGYQVWRDIVSSVTPHVGSAQLLHTVTTSTWEYLDETASAGNHYYTLVAENDSSEAPPSNGVGIFRFDLTVAP